MKTIPGYNYMIDESGLVKSARTGKRIKPYLSMGYLKIDLYKDGKRRKVFIHQLIGECFLNESYFESAIINHKDGNRLNNSVQNLEWVTYSQNIKHAYDFLGMKCPARKKGSESIHAIRIKQLSISGEFIKVYGSITEAIKEYGSGVEKVLYSKRKTAYGFKWEYA